MKVFKQLIYTLVFITVVAGCTPNAISFNNNDDKKKDKNNQLLLGLFVLSQDQAVTTYTGSMNNSQYGHTATLLNNGKVLIVGDGAELYDPKKDKFESIDSRTKKRYLHKAILLKNGKVLICDGFSNFKFTIFDNSVELYNPDTNTFSQAGNMNEQRRNFSATLLNSGKVLLMGGYDLDFKVLSSAELYNPDINIFSTTGSLKKTRFFLGDSSVLLKDGNVLTGISFSGKAENLKKGTSANLISEIELYDSENGTFSNVGQINLWQPRKTMSFDNGKVFVVNSSGLQNKGTEITIFNPKSKKFTRIKQYLTLDFSYEFTKFQNRFVLFSGGKSTEKYTAAISKLEVFDSGVEKVLDAGNMMTPRYNHRATLLQDGRILITGGCTEDIAGDTEAHAGIFEISALSSAEIYSP